MRLWHQKLINKLPRQQLLGQHREAAALRGKGWNKPHSTVNYVFQYNYYRLVHYHQLVIKEMRKRGYNPDLTWMQPDYRGKNCARRWEGEPYSTIGINIIYPEHNDQYLQECIDNLMSKGAVCRFMENYSKEGI